MSTKKKTNTKSNNDKDVKTTSYVPMIVAIVALILVVAIVLPIALGGGKSDPLADYTEDTSTEKKDYYYVAMAIEDEGVIIVKLDAKNAPITTANFVKLVRAGFYDGLTFHRVMENFMIQGGDPQANGLGGSDETIIGEFITNGVYNPIKHEKGVISMARGSHSNDSASSQFFICNSSSASVQGLDGYYAAFGHVIEGIEIVDNITAKTARFGVNNGMITNKKKQAVITKMMVIEYEETV